MPVGMEILNTSGSIMINQDLKGMQMATKINSSSLSMTSTGSLAFTNYHWNGSVPYTDCIFAVANVSGNNNVVKMTTGVASGGNTAFTVTAKSASASFDVYVFRPSGNWATSPGYGFEVYNADGTLGFGSTYKPLKVLSQFEWYADQNSGSGFFDDGRVYSETYAGKKIACVFSRHGAALDGEGTLINMTVPIYSTFFYQNGSGSGSLEWRVTTDAGKDFPYWERKGRFMFIDVTNY